MFPRRNSGQLPAHFEPCRSRSAAFFNLSASARSMSICICSAVSVSPLASLKSTFSKMVLSAANSGISASTIGELALRHLRVRTGQHDFAAPFAQSLAASLRGEFEFGVLLLSTFVPMDFVLRDGRTTRFLLEVSNLRVRKINKLTRGNFTGACSGSQTPNLVVTGSVFNKFAYGNQKLPYSTLPG